MVAIFRQLANDIGEKNMRAYLHKMHCGNKDISTGLDNFWLNVSIKISAQEQVQLLRKTYHNQFAFDARAITELKKVMLLEVKPHYRLYGKTGTPVLPMEIEYFENHRQKPSKMIAVKPKIPYLSIN